MDRHLSVWKAAIFSIICVGIFLFGLLIAFISGTQNNEAGIMQGLGISGAGFLIGILNKFVFRVRRKQLEVDRDETIRNGISKSVLKQQKSSKKKYFVIIIFILLIPLWLYGNSIGA